MRRRWGLGLIAAGALVGGLAAGWKAGSAMTRGGPSAVPPAIAPARDVWLRSADGVRLAGTYWPGRRPGSPSVLLLHGVGASRAAMAPNAAWLASLGYAALTIDFRGHGQSAVRPRSFGLREATDARAAFDWLRRERPGAKVAVIGVSMGGAAALLGSEGPLPADALVLQAVYPDIRHAIRDRIASRFGAVPGWLLEPLLSLQAPLRFGVWPGAMAPIAALPHYAGPVLVVGGMQDRFTPPDETRAMAAAAGRRARLWLRPTGSHAEVSEAADPAYRARLLAFLRTTVGPA